MEKKPYSISIKVLFIKFMYAFYQPDTDALVMYDGRSIIVYDQFGFHNDF